MHTICLEIHYITESLILEFLRLLSGWHFFNLFPQVALKWQSSLKNRRRELPSPSSLRISRPKKILNNQFHSKPPALRKCTVHWSGVSQSSTSSKGCAHKIWELLLLDIHTWQVSEQSLEMQGFTNDEKHPFIAKCHHEESTLLYFVQPFGWKLNLQTSNLVHDNCQFPLFHSHYLKGLDVFSVI